MLKRLTNLFKPKLVTLENKNKRLNPEDFLRQLEWTTLRRLDGQLQGDYRTWFKGSGLELADLREYQTHDDVRHIDWNVTARFSHPFVKVFEEERELTVMLLVDISGSSLFGTSIRLKRELITELCAVLSFAAATNNDKVGVVFFSDKIERYIPPKKGKSHILRIIRELLTIEASPNSGTDVSVPLAFLNSVLKKKTIAFLMSDFVSPLLDKALMLAARKHDLVGIHVYDASDKELPQLGLVQVQDAETGIDHWIDTSDAQLRQRYTYTFENNRRNYSQAFTKSGASWLSIRTDQDYVKSLQTYFKGR
jgi:uncharacterized protein (DUF58 family)